MSKQEQEFYKSIHDIFREPSTGLTPEIKHDFRKICAKYSCAGEGLEHLCVRFESTQSGLCKFKDGSDCLAL